MYYTCIFKLFVLLILFLLACVPIRVTQASSAQLTSTSHPSELSVTSTDKSSILVITADGAVSSLDSVTGKENWSLRTGKPLVSSSTMANVEEARALIPALDGSGEIFYIGDSGDMQKLPVTVHDIVASSPLLHHSDSNVDTLFIGSKSTSIFAVNPIDGRLLKIMSNQPNNAYSSNDDTYTYDDCPAGLPSETLLIGRADYYIRAIDPKSGLERWNVTIGEYMPYLTTREKTDFPFDPPKLVTQGNSLHAIAWDNEKLEWSAPIQAPLVTAFTLSGSTHLQKLGFAHSVPSLPPPPSPSPSPSTALAPQPQVFVALVDNQPFATSNPALVFQKNVPHTPHLLPSPSDPSSSSSSSSLVNPSLSPSLFPLSPGLYHVTSPDLPPNKTIGAGTIPSPSTSLADALRELAAHPTFYPVLASGLALATVGLYLGSRSRTKRKPKRVRGNNAKSEPAPQPTPVAQPKAKEEKKKAEEERKKVEEEKKKVEEEKRKEEQAAPQVGTEENGGEVVGEGGATSGSDGNNPKNNANNNNTPAKRKQPNKRKEKIRAPLIYAKTKGKKTKASDAEGEGGTGEVGEAPEKEIEKPAKSVRIVTEDGITKIGTLEITQNILGYGSGGTIVFEGFLHGRRVAVKRMLAQFMDLAQQEISLLITSDEHPNVVRYHAKEEDEEFVYLALSYCPHTLHNVIEHNLNSVLNFDFRKRKNEPYPVLDPDIMRVLRELVAGVAHLHMLNIVHRDIKPQNTLLDPSRRVKISDMGLAKKLEIDQSSFSGQDTGSFGWKAPEVLTGGDGRLTKAVDVFSLGCLIFYILTKSHPFGDRYEREARILTGRSDLREVEGWPEAHHLIRSMIRSNPEERPTAQECLHHPFFWTTQQKMHFLIAASDYVEFEKPTAPVVIALDLRIGELMRPPPDPMRAQYGEVMTDWLPALDPLLVANLVRYRQYKSTSLRDLLRVMRNKYNHFRDLPPELQQVMGPVPEGFYAYFCMRFPRLLLCVYEVVKEYFRDEDVFGVYFYKHPLKDTKEKEKKKEEAKGKEEVKNTEAQEKEVKDTEA